ncbi:MAG: hypothetical protein IPL01_22355, partial [Acidobacteria bacterium]|nr:hypothetical protein [Acidobacteriota bacterium]
AGVASCRIRRENGNSDDSKNRYGAGRWKAFTTVPDELRGRTFNVRVAGPGMTGMGFAVVSGNGQQSGDGMFQFFSQEMSFDNRLVKDAPFSGETLSETVADAC